MFKKHKQLLLSVLNIFWFLFFILKYPNGIEEIIGKEWLIALLAALLLSLVLKKHLKKIVVMQLVMAVITFGVLTPRLLKSVATSTSWKQLPDDIAQVEFKKRPNIYIIQPDGYANFSELKRGYYNFDNVEFESYLAEENFKLYNDFRGNYFSTVSSNSSVFSMKHHYYDNPKPFDVESYNYRRILAGNNPVISIFNNNNYKTSLILESEYLLANRAKLYYDYCNIDYNEISYLTQGFKIKKDVKKDLETAIKINDSQGNFYFIEKILPGHVSPSRLNNKGKEKEREDYLFRIKQANEWLKEIITMINSKDPNSLIIIMADHGGYVGMNSTYECKIKQTDDDLIKSVFTSALAIKWPNVAPEFDEKLKTSVNLFRVLFSYLSDNKAYLNHLEEDKSYLVIKKGAPFGVYETINENSEVIFKEVVD